jgi:uncharacterized protein YbaR (Trm112 family)
MPSFDRPAWVLEVLRCPISHQRLHWCDDALIERLNEKICEGGLYDRVGDVVTRPYEAAFINASQQWVYRVTEEMADLLPAHAVELPDGALGAGG